MNYLQATCPQLDSWQSRKFILDSFFFYATAWYIVAAIHFSRVPDIRRSPRKRLRRKRRSAGRWGNAAKIVWSKWTEVQRLRSSAMFHHRQLCFCSWQFSIVCQEMHETSWNITKQYETWNDRGYTSKMPIVLWCFMSINLPVVQVLQSVDSHRLPGAAFVWDRSTWMQFLLDLAAIWWLSFAKLGTKTKHCPTAETP